MRGDGWGIAVREFFDSPLLEDTGQEINEYKSK